MRWAASMVADVHRILMRGGVFLYPRDTRDPETPGRTDPVQGQPDGHAHRTGGRLGLDRLQTSAALYRPVCTRKPRSFWARATKSNGSNATTRSF